MSAIADLVEKFYGNDPIAGEDACLELLNNWRDDAIDALIPLDSGGYSESYQVELRLKYVASILGNNILPHLVRVISSGPWRSKVKAAICFSGLKASDETEAPLIKSSKLHAISTRRGTPLTRSDVSARTDGPLRWVDTPNSVFGEQTLMMMTTMR